MGTGHTEAPCPLQMVAQTADVVASYFYYFLAGWVGKQLGREKETNSESQRGLKGCRETLWGGSQSRPAVTSQLPGQEPSPPAGGWRPRCQEQKGGGPIRTGASEAAGASKT